jgi:hypothetical protein
MLRFQYSITLTLHIVDETIRRITWYFCILLFPISFFPINGELRATLFFTTYELGLKFSSRVHEICNVENFVLHERDVEEIGMQLLGI